MKKLFAKLFNRATLITETVSARCVDTIKRYLADGFTVVFRGAVAVLTKWVKV
jgi:hypothetical protein